MDERLRYAPHRASPEERAEYFKLVIPKDEAAIIDSVPSEFKNKLGELLSTLHAPLIEVPSKDKPFVHLLSLGDCLMNEIRVFLIQQARREGIPLDMRILYFSAAMNCELSIGDVVDYLEKYAV